MNHPEIILVLARASNGVIGKDGGMPWHIPADLRHFKQVTNGRPMIMGRKTFDSLPGLLDGRRHIVLTRHIDWEEDGAEVVHSVEEALKLANGPHVCVIGGAEIYKLFLPIADRVELTEIDAEPEGDTEMAAFDSDEWQEIARESHPAENGIPRHDFVTLVRKGVMRKRYWIPLALLGVAAIGFFGIAPGYVEGSMNRIDGKPLIKVSDEAEALHETLTIVDLHSDTLMWDRNVLEQASRGHMDLPRLRDGNVALQLFSSVTKTPKGQNYDGNGADSDNITLLTVAQLQPPKTWNSLVERSLYHAAKRDAAVRHADGRMLSVDSGAQLDKLLAVRQGNRKAVGAMLTIEGLQNLEGKAANLDRLYNAGFRMAGLTHFFDNELGGSMHGLKKGGLTPFGRDIVRRMEAKGMIVDIAHLSHTGVAELLAMARRPVVSSHGGVQATCKVNRNLTDDEIRGVAKTGGLIGIGYWEGAVCDTSPRAAAKAMKHVRDLVGIQHVALGSDYDGATTVRFDTSQLAQVTQALIDEGFTEPEIRAVMGENALRIIRAGIVPMTGKANPNG